MIKVISALIVLFERALRYVDSYVRKRKENDRQYESDAIDADPADWMQNHFAAKTDKTDNRDGKTE